MPKGLSSHRLGRSCSSRIGLRSCGGRGEKISACRRRLDDQRLGRPRGRGAGQRYRAATGSRRGPARRSASTLAAVEPRLRWSPHAQDGQNVVKGQCVGTIEGPARGLLAPSGSADLLGRLSGIATLARQYVDAVIGTKARIYDTRKTAPGWRRWRSMRSDAAAPSTTAAVCARRF